MFLLVAVSVALGWILLPLYGTIMWGAIIALLFSPLYRWMLLRLKQRRTPAALLTLLLVLLIVILPFALVTASLAREVTLIYERMQSGELNPALYFRGVFSALPAWMTSLLDRFGLVDFDALQRRDGIGDGAEAHLAHLGVLADEQPDCPCRRQWRRCHGVRGRRPASR